MTLVVRPSDESVEQRTCDCPRVDRLGVLHFDRAVSAEEMAALASGQVRLCRGCARVMARG